MKFHTKISLATQIKNMNQATENFNKIVVKLPQLTSILLKINSTDIKYGLYAGSHVSILTSNRVPTDVDFLVADDDFVKLKNLFPFAQTKDYGDAKFLYIGKHDEIEFMSFADVNIGSSHYNFRLSDLCWKKSGVVDGVDYKVRVLNEVDTILLKAMLQRGKDLGKHDFEDIEAILQQQSIDKEYLSKRLLEVKQDQRLLDVLKKFELI